MFSSTKKIQIPVLCGPTATGKTALGAELAYQKNWKIYSADSRQVYRGLDIGTGKDLAEYSQYSPPVPFEFIDIVDPIRIYSVFHYQQKFYQLLRGYLEDSTARQPLVVGGTGMYIEAVLRNYNLFNVPEDIGFRLKLKEKSQDELLKSWLEVQDSLPHFLKLNLKVDVSSKKRLIRALEIIEFSKYQEPQITRWDGPPILSCVVCLLPSLVELKKKIFQRLEVRIEEGLVEEAQNLHQSGLSFHRMEALGLEYRYLSSYLKGQIEFSEFKKQLGEAIYQMARSQITYFRGLPKRGVEVHFMESYTLKKVKEVYEQYGF